MTSTELKQRIAESLSAPFEFSYEGISTVKDLLRDCLSHIEEQDKREGLMVVERSNYFSALQAKLSEAEKTYTNCLAEYIHRIAALEKERDQLRAEVIRLTTRQKEYEAKYNDMDHTICTTLAENQRFKAALEVKDEALRKLDKEIRDMANGLEEEGGSEHLIDGWRALLRNTSEKALSPTAGNDLVKREDLRQTVDLLDRMQVTGKVNHEKLQAELLRLESLLSPAQ